MHGVGTDFLAYLVPIQKVDVDVLVYLTRGGLLIVRRLIPYHIQYHISSLYGISRKIRFHLLWLTRYI